MGVTPLQLEQMHPDQILLMICDKERLESGRKLVKLSPEEAQRQGYLPVPQSNKSLVQQMREQIEAKRKAKAREDRRQRRKERIQRRAEQAAKD